MALLDRVQSVMLRPQMAWLQISAEPDTVNNILTQYALPLVGFATVCRLIGLLFVMALFGPIFTIGSAVIGFIVGIASIYLIALIIDALAPSFGAMKNPLQAMKVSAYSYTPAAVGAVFLLIPIAGGLLTALVSLYSIYQMYLGLISTMGAPRERAIAYTAVTFIIAIVVILVISFILNLAIVPFMLHPAVPAYPR